MEYKCRLLLLWLASEDCRCADDRSIQNSARRRIHARVDRTDATLHNVRSHCARLRRRRSIEIQPRVLKYTSSGIYHTEAYSNTLVACSVPTVRQLPLLLAVRHAAHLQSRAVVVRGGGVDPGPPAREQLPVELGAPVRAGETVSELVRFGFVSLTTLLLLSWCPWRPSVKGRCVQRSDCLTRVKPAHRSP